MQDKETTLFGTHQKGTLKNGIFRGLEAASLEEAKRNSEELKNMKGYIEVDPNYKFLVYLDKPFAFDEVDSEYP